jgi:DNA repair exonuclease SbcCD nuclease subunit
MSIKILHLADIHCNDRDIDEVSRCMTKVISTAREEAVDLIVIAGDIFDSRDIKLDSQSALFIIGAISILANIAPVAIVMGTPSHDGKAPAVLEHVRGDYPVIVASKPEQFFLLGSRAIIDERWLADIGGAVSLPDSVKVLAVLTLIPTPTKQFFQGSQGSDIKTGDMEIAQAMNALFAGFGATASQFECPHILVGHWNTTGSLISETQILTGVDIEISPDAMMLAEPDLVLLGHIHKSQQIKDRIFYSGSLFPNSWGELDDKGFYIHDAETNGLSVFYKTPCKKMVRVKRDFTSEDDRQWQIADCVKDAIVRVDLTMWQDEAETIDKETVRQFYMASGALDVDIRINRIPRVTVRSEAVLKAETLREKLIAMAALRDEEVPENVLVKADQLEEMEAEKIIGMVGGSV